MYWKTLIQKYPQDLLSLSVVLSVWLWWWHVLYVQKDFPRYHKSPFHQMYSISALQHVVLLIQKLQTLPFQTPGNLPPYSSYSSPQVRLTANALFWPPGARVLLRRTWVCVHVWRVCVKSVEQKSLKREREGEVAYKHRNTRGFNKPELLVLFYTKWGKSENFAEKRKLGIKKKHYRQTGRQTGTSSPALPLCRLTKQWRGIRFRMSAHLVLRSEKQNWMFKVKILTWCWILCQCACVWGWCNDL